MSDVADAIARVHDRVTQACARSGRDPNEVTIVAVTKQVEAARAAEATRAGLLDLGENRVQELMQKRNDERLAGVRWHLVGTLQRNKVRSVTGAVELIHSVDSESLAGSIGARATAAGTVQDVLLQVNVSGEPTKHGVEPAVARHVAGSIAGLDGVRLRGLMAIASPDDRARARKEFSLLRSLRDETQAELPSFAELSMGMSDDFEEAVEEGATIVRVGTAIFGPRLVPGRGRRPA